MILSEILKVGNRKAEDITKIYRGKDHWCRCGCGGVYHDKGKKGFTQAINRMNKPEFETWDVDYGPNYINIPYDDYNDLCYCVYFD